MSLEEKKEGAVPTPVTTPSENNASSTDCTIQNLVKIDKTKAAEFLSLLERNGAFTFQTFDDRKCARDPRLTKVFHGTLEEHFLELKELNEAGAGIFVTINKTDLKGRKKENIKKVRAIFVDLDGAPLLPILKAPLRPHIIVSSSPERFHCYWLIEDLDLGAFAQVQKTLSKRYDADTAVSDLPRVMRLPGFLHRKGDSFLVHIMTDIKEPPYQASSFLKEFGLAFSEKESEFHDPILRELSVRGMIKRDCAHSHPGKWDILCPFSEVHTTGSDGTAYFEPHTNGYSGPGFKCHHAHCREKGIKDLKKYLGMEVSFEEEWDEPIPLIEPLLPVAPLTQDMLPAALCPWIVDITERMQVPLDFVAVPEIVVLGSLLGRKVGLFPKALDDWLVVPNLWGGIVGRSAFLKSPSIAEVMKPLNEMTGTAMRAYTEEKASYEQELLWVDAKKSAHKDVLKKAARTLDRMPSMPILEEPQIPYPQRYKTEDGTVEKIAEILLHNPQGILIHRDELTGLLKSLDRYGHEGDRAFYLESWNGTGSFTIDRIGRGTLHVEALCLSILGGIQPGPLKEYIYQAREGGSGDDGLLQRFQLLVWPDPVATWVNVDRAPDLAARENAYRIFKKFDALGSAGCGHIKMHTMRFSVDAQKDFDSWRHQHELKLREGSLSPPLESHLAKYRSLMPKLALIFCLIDTPEEHFPPRSIDRKAVQRAIAWVTYLETHARRLYASAEAANMEAARALLKRIEAGDLVDGFSIRSVYHSRHWSQLDTQEKVMEAVKILEDFGWVRYTELKKSIGRTSTAVYLHPYLKKRAEKEK